MEQNRKPIDPAVIEEVIEKMKNRGRYEPGVYELVREDMQLGITREETRGYTEKGYSLQQMQVYSKCLRKNFSEDEISFICNRELQWEQMEQLYRLREDGMTMEQLQAYAKSVNFNTTLLQTKQVQSPTEQTNPAADPEPDPSMHQLMQGMEKLAKSVALMAENYENKFQRLSETITENHAGEKQIENYKAQIAEKENLLSHQQDEIQREKGKNARLEQEKEQLERRLQIMSKKLEKEETADTERNGKTQETVPQQAVTPAAHRNGQTEKIIDYEPVETYEKKKPAGILELFMKICLKKTSRADIVRLVTKGELSTEQLAQIKHAIESGLTEQQLTELINNNVEAEKMKEIIEIAVLENKLAG